MWSFFQQPVSQTQPTEVKPFPKQIERILRIGLATKKNVDIQTRLEPLVGFR